VRMLVTTAAGLGLFNCLHTQLGDERLGGAVREESYPCELYPLLLP
jgi:hypothetical protein